MAAGSRRFKIIVQRATKADDTSGQPVETWSTYIKRWASVEATGGSERFKGHQIMANMTHVIELVSDSETRLITPGMRVVWRGRTINLMVARPLDGKIREIQLQGVEIVDP